MDSKQLTDNITGLIFNKKGFDVKILELRELTAMADYFVICSADSDTQVKAIADESPSKSTISWEVIKTLLFFKK